MHFEEANRVLNLCRLARLTPSGEIAGMLLRMTNPSMPPNLL